MCLALDCIWWVCLVSISISPSPYPPPLRGLVRGKAPCSLPKLNLPLKPCPFLSWPFLLLFLASSFDFQICSCLCTPNCKGKGNLPQEGKLLILRLFPLPEPWSFSKESWVQAPMAASPTCSWTLSGWLLTCRLTTVLDLLSWGPLHAMIIIFTTGAFPQLTDYWLLIE